MAKGSSKDLVANITANNAQFLKKIKESEIGVGLLAKKAEAGTKFLDNLFKAAGAVFFVNKIKDAVEKLGELQDTSEKLGISAEQIQGLGIAAEQAGTNFEAVSAAIGKGTISIGKANAGSEELQDTFSKLGLSYQELAQLSPDQQFIAIGKALSQVENRTERTTLGIKLFGKGFKEVSTLIDTDIQGNIDKFKELGIIADDATVALADDVGDRLAIVGKQIGAIFTVGLASALPFIEEVTTGVENLIKSMGGVGGAVFTLTEGIKKPFNELETLLDSVYNRFLKINAFVNSNDIGNKEKLLISGGAAGIGSSYDPIATGEYANKPALRSDFLELRLARGQATSAQDLVNQSENNPLNTFAASTQLEAFQGVMGIATDRTKEFNQNVGKASESLKKGASAFDSLSKKGFSSTLDDILKRTNSEQDPVTQDEDFNNRAADILNLVSKGYQRDQLSNELASLNGLRDRYGDNNLAQMNAINEINKFIDNNATDKNKQQVEVKVSAGPEFDVKIKKSVEAGVVSYTEAEARKVS